MIEAPERQFTDRIAPEALDVLAHSVEVTENRVKLTCGQLERSTYEAVNEVLERIGGKWAGKKKVHEFAYDPSPLLAAVIATGLMPPKNPLAYFPTPKPIVDKMIEWADLHKLYEPAEARFLEPSAGQGAIVRAIIEAGFSAGQIDVCEADELNVSVLGSQGHTVVERDFLEFWPEHKYDRILMNPPFSVDEDKRAFVAHIEHAWTLLAPGGSLIAIAPPFCHQTDSRLFNFASWVALHGMWEDIEAGAFKESGTGISTVIIEMTKQYPHEEIAAREPYNGYKNYEVYKFWLYADCDRETCDRRDKIVRDVVTNGELPDKVVEGFIEMALRRGWREKTPFGLHRLDYPNIRRDLLERCKEEHGYTLLSETVADLSADEVDGEQLAMFA